MRRGAYSYLIILVFSVWLLGAQNNRAIDSLRHAFQKEETDTGKVKIKTDLAYQWRFTNPDSTLIEAKEALALSEKAGDEMWYGRALSLMGYSYATKLDPDEAIQYYLKAIKVFEKLQRKFELAKTEVNLGVSYSAKSNYTNALEVYYSALSKLEELKENKIRAIVLGNIGIIHFYNQNFEKAIDFAEKAMKIDLENKNEEGVARHLGNIGSHYLDLATALAAKGKKKEAEEKYNAGLTKLLKAYAMFEQQGNKALMATNLGNIASAYDNLGDTAKAIEFYNKAYKLDEELDNKSGMARHLGNIGWSYMEQKKYKAAEAYIKRALETLEGVSDFPMLNKLHANISAIYEITGNIPLAFEHYKKSIIYRDSIFNIENAKKNLSTEMNFEFQKKENAAKEESARQAIIRNVFIGGFVVALLMGLLVLRGYRIKQKANKLISKQKELLEEKNKEITDSILYAKRIQNAHLPSNEYISKKMNELKSKN